MRIILAPFLRDSVFKASRFSGFTSGIKVRDSKLYFTN